MKKELVQSLLGVTPFARTTLFSGGVLMAGCYLCALFALWLAPTAINYAGTMQAARGFLEAGPACLAAAFSAAVICDLVLRHRQQEEQ